MLPLNLISQNGSLNNPTHLLANLQKLKEGNVNGVMTDVWWGLVEVSPRNYKWDPYLQLASMVKQVGLKLQVVMSFHQCGTNVGDACYIPLPSWVLSVGKSNPDMFYRDSQRGVDTEYLSLGIDNIGLFDGRSPVQIYSDFMNQFASTFAQYIPSTIDQIQVGLGPSGELRYPSYQLQNNKWTYCGVGEFQCYDKYMLEDLKKAATNAGHPEWGNGGPNNAGSYNSRPFETTFFSDNGGDNYASPYGEFFLNWYSSKLIQHGDSILSLASSTFNSLGASVAAKVSGIHWWYKTNSHAAELTAGYFNTDQQNAYQMLANMFAKYKIVFDFTALEMVDSDTSCASGPQELVKQTILAAAQAGIAYAGENALELCSNQCNTNGFNEIYQEATQYGKISRFTYLRISDNLLYNNANWQIFTNFVNRMQNA